MSYVYRITVWFPSFGGTEPNRQELYCIAKTMGEANAIALKAYSYAKVVAGVELGPLTTC